MVAVAVVGLGKLSDNNINKIAASSTIVALAAKSSSDGNSG